MTSEANRSERSRNVEPWPSDEEYKSIKEKITQDHHGTFAEYISNQKFSRDWTKEELGAAAALLSRFFFGVYMIARRNKFEDRDYQLLYSENLEEQGIAHFAVDENYPQGVFRINVDELKEFANHYFEYLSARSYDNLETMLDHYELAGVEEAAHYYFFKTHQSFGRASQKIGNPEIDYFNQIERNGLAVRYAYCKRYLPRFLSELKTKAKRLVGIPLEKAHAGS